MIKKVKNTVPWTYVTEDLNAEDIVGTVYEKEIQKTNQSEKVLNGKIMIIHLTAE